MHGRLRMVAGETVHFGMHSSTLAETPGRVWGQDDLRDGLDATVRAWQSWSAHHQAYEGPWKDLVHRSGRVLGALSYQPGSSHRLVATRHPTSPFGVMFRRTYDRPTGVGVTERRAAAKGKKDEMSVTMVRQKVKNGSIEEAEAAVRDLFATLDRMGPAGVCHASTRVVDSATFVILFELAEGIEDPRPAIPEYLRFIEQLKGWVEGPPVIEHLDVVGSYDLFRTQREESV
jgi:hypothetical protein